MNITITIDSNNRSENVLVDSLRIKDHINQQANEARFTCVGFRPNVSDEVTIMDGGVKIFAGVIIRVEQVHIGLKTEYIVECKDWTHYLDRNLVSERYEDTTVAAVLSDILTNYTTGFTDNNVVGNQLVTSVAFNRISVSDCIEQLARLTGYSWYVDYDRDLHFFEKNQNPAPFNLTENGDNHVWDSLRIAEDLSQLRNRIYVIGGETEGNARTETYVADGEQLQIPLANKYATKPTVEVDSVSQDVGVDFLDAEDDFDCFWSFQEKYLRFKTGTKPAADAVVATSGIPLYPIIVNVPSALSISEYGEYEFRVKDSTIRSRDEAIDRARVELQQYAQTIEEGSFITYRSGLCSGQVITITIGDTNANFLIQSVSLSMRTPVDGEWRVTVATLKTVGIIDFLRSLLRDDGLTQDEAETLLNLLDFSDAIEISESLTLPANITSPPYVWGPSAGNEMRWNFFTWT